MNIRKYTAVALLLLACVTASAQRVSKSDPNVVFDGHWILQAQGGLGFTYGMDDRWDFKDVVSESAALYLGYRFTPVWGIRFGASGWVAKGDMLRASAIYEFNYVQANVDILLDISNWWGGYRHDRFFDVYLFAGPGYNWAFNNDDAVALSDAGCYFGKLWRKNLNDFSGHGGIGANLRLGNHVAITLEAGANILSDDFNSTKSGHPDFHFTGMAGLTFSLGKTHKRKPVYGTSYSSVSDMVPAGDRTSRLEAEAEHAREVEALMKDMPDLTAVPAMTESIFFEAESVVIGESEMSKIDNIAAYLSEHEAAIVNISGYSDEHTGWPSSNMEYSAQRAEAVSQALQAKGISSERIYTEGKGDVIQPFKENSMNRVVVCEVVDFQ